VIQALPVLRLLKLHFRDAEIFWWIDSALAPLLEGDPDLPASSALNANAGHRRGTGRKCSAASAGCANKISTSSLTCNASRAAARSPGSPAENFSSAWTKSAKARAAFTTSPCPKIFPHARRGLVSVRAAALGVPVHKNFHWLPERPAVAAEVKRKWLGKMAIRNSQLDCTCKPGARWLNKRWPVEILPNSSVCSRKISRRSLCHPRRRGRQTARRNHFTRRAGAQPEFVRRNFPAGNGRVAAALRLDGDERHRPDARRRRARQTARRALRPHRTAPHRPYGQLENVLRIELPCSPCLKGYCTYEKPNECLNAISPAMVFERVRKQLQSRA
jgi:hypothetical protein